MANKFYGVVGYGMTEEVVSGTGASAVGTGVWKDTIVERNYYGDVIKNYKKMSPGESINDNIDISNSISIVSDPFAMQHFHTIKYVKWMGAVWKVISVEIQYPRLILSIGGVYNGETAGAS